MHDNHSIPAAFVLMPKVQGVKREDCSIGIFHPNRYQMPGLA